MKTTFCQYKALLLQCEKDYDVIIYVRLYQEIVLPYFQIKYGQFAAVALVRSGANKNAQKSLGSVQYPNR